MLWAKQPPPFPKEPWKTLLNRLTGVTRLMTAQKPWKEVQMPYDSKAVGRRLKSGLADTGMTAEQLADAIGMSRFAVGDWLIGRSTPSFETSVKICDVFGWPLDRLAVRGEYADQKAVE